jgi:hypothetical protein
LAGTPRVALDAMQGEPGMNLVVDLYDVDEKGMAIIISRQAALVGPGRVSFDLYDQHWKLAKGHRIGVMVTGANQGWWLHRPTFQTVRVLNASISLPFIQCQRRQDLEGTSAIRLDNYLRNEPFQLPASLITDNTIAGFPQPEALRACSTVEQGGGGDCVDRRKFAFRIKQPRGGRIVRATAYLDGKKLKTVRSKRVTRLIISRFPKGTHTLRIVAQHASGKKTITTRRYRGCNKGAPTTIVRT